MSTQIPAAKAWEFINNYRRNLPAGSLKSAWLNRDIIDACIALNETNQLDGIRVYPAKYSEDDPGGKYSKDADTIILVLTENSLANEGKNIDTAFFDYSQICPPHCPQDGG